MRRDGFRIEYELFDFSLFDAVVSVTVSVVSVVLEVVFVVVFEVVVVVFVVFVVFVVVVVDVVDVVTIFVVVTAVVSIVVLRGEICKVSMEFVIPSIESHVKLSTLLFAASRISLLSTSLCDSASNIAIAAPVCLFRLRSPDCDCDCDSVSFARSKRVTLIS